jgi:hypothetical protein
MVLVQNEQWISRKSGKGPGTIWRLLRVLNDFGGGHGTRANDFNGQMPELLQSEVQGTPSGAAS